MKRYIVFLLALLAVTKFGSAQDSTLYAKQFPGNDVGTKVTNAMAACNPNRSIPCILVVDPSLAAIAPGTMPSLCSHCFLMDYRIGPPSQTGSISSAPILNLISLADQYTGSDCGAKINAAFAASSVTSVQVGPNCGNITTAVSVPSNRTLQFLSPGTIYSACATITLGHNSTISGLPAASNGLPVALQEATGCNLSSLVSMSGNSVIHDILLDGNKANNPSGLDTVLVNNANRVHIYNVTIQNAERDNIHVTSRMYPGFQAGQSYALNAVVTAQVSTGGFGLYIVTVAGTSGASATSLPPSGTATSGTVTFSYYGKLLDDSSGDGYLGPDVLLQYAGRNDFFVERQADWIISSQVEFEASRRDGFHCEDCATFRFSNDDFGSNGRYGFYAAVVNLPLSSEIQTAGHMVTGSQFGGNLSGDIYISGSAYVTNGGCTCELAGSNSLTGNTFIQNHASPNVNSVTFVDAGGENMTGNVFGFIQPSDARPYNYLISNSFSQITYSPQQYPSSFVGNTFLPGTWSAASPVSLASSDSASNIEGSSGWITHHAGTISGNLTGSGKTASHKFRTEFSSTPQCLVTPTSNSGAFYISAESSTAITVTYATSGEQTFNVTCSGSTGAAW